MRKIIIIAAVIVGIVILVGLYFIIANRVSPGSGAAANGEPITKTADQGVPASQALPGHPTGQFITIGTKTGSVQVNNFYLSDPPVVEGGTVVLKQGAGYAITYNSADSSFWLDIIGAPFSDIRVAAEQDFLVTLGIGASDACKLTVTVGASLPLNFCASGQ